VKSVAIADRTAIPAFGEQILSFAGLRFDATLGVLSHEHEDAQPISVDVDLNMGLQPLLPKGDDIVNVLDYRIVRQTIIDECKSGHVNLIETLIGRVARRLLCVPGVLGVRIKIVKLRIFDDCEVGIRMEIGRW
jgi:7,8-dihydroneopterin aldolase/epimerase/oxygenase